MIRIETEGMKEMEAEFGKASIPNTPSKSIGKLDNVFGAAAAAVRSRVHIDTGYLASSGRDSTHYVNDIWIGEITYARYPGIFELARGDTPTVTHPTGGHFFFNAVEPFIPHMDNIINDLFDDYFSKARV